MFAKNTRGFFVHEMECSGYFQCDGDSSYVLVQVSNQRRFPLDREKAARPLVSPSFTELCWRRPADDPTLSDRTWVLLTEAV